VTWQVFVRADVEDDLDRLDDAEQRLLAEDMFAWVADGPPRRTTRDVLGVRMFDDDLGERFRVTYVVDEDNRRIFVVRIRCQNT
jgi:mRNA-degrading endonuclease RelE of RelBE toxin-antitoxin system